MTHSHIDGSAQYMNIEPKRVLITGATGAIGRAIYQHLIDRGHHVCGLGRSSLPELADYIQADLSDRAALDRAVEGMDTVLHLAAFRNDADFIDVLLEPNVVGLYNICEAAAKHGVARLMLASTLQVVDGYTKDEEPIAADAPARPTSHYGLTKAWYEIAGDMYARNHNISVINARICWLPRDPEYAHRLANSERGVDIFFSHDDARRFFTCCVESSTPKRGESVTVYATSNALRRTRLELESTKRLLGYVPQDSWPDGLPFAV